MIRSSIPATAQMLEPFYLVLEMTANGKKKAIPSDISAFFNEVLFAATTIGEPEQLKTASIEALTLNTMKLKHQEIRDILTKITSIDDLSERDAKSLLSAWN